VIGRLMGWCRQADSAAADCGLPAEHKVKHRPQQRHEAYDTDPKRGGRVSRL